MRHHNLKLLSEIHWPITKTIMTVCHVSFLVRRYECTNVTILHRMYILGRPTSSTFNSILYMQVKLSGQRFPVKNVLKSCHNVIFKFTNLIYRPILTLLQWLGTHLFIGYAKFLNSCPRLWKAHAVAPNFYITFDIIWQCCDIITYGYSSGILV